jgi:hypothetical protein
MHAAISIDLIDVIGLWAIVIEFLLPNTFIHVPIRPARYAACKKYVRAYSDKCMHAVREYIQSAAAYQYMHAAYCTQYMHALQLICSLADGNPRASTARLCRVATWTIVICSYAFTVYTDGDAYVDSRA